MFDKIRNEPARIVAVVLALIGVLTSLGLGITDGQQSAVVALVGAVLAVLGGETVRAQVRPTRKTGPLSIANLNVDGKAVYDAVVKHDRETRRRTGKSPLDPPANPDDSGRPKD